MRNYTFNRQLSEKAARIIDAQLNKCWTNAYRALKKVPELREADYIEGFVLRKIIPILLEHGWLELCGQIIDPTRILWQTQFNNVLYFPGILLTADDIQSRIKRVSQVPLFRQYGLNGFGYPPYEQAYKNAIKESGLPMKALQNFMASSRKHLSIISS